MTQREVSCKGYHKVGWKYNIVVAQRAVLTHKERPACRSLEPKLQYAIVTLPIFHVKRNTETSINIVGHVSLLRTMTPAACSTGQTERVGKGVHKSLGSNYGTNH